MKKLLILVSVVLLAGCVAQSQVHGLKRSRTEHSMTGAESKKKSERDTDKNQNKKPLRYKTGRATMWVDSLVNEMTLKDQIAQLMVIRVPLNLEGKAQREFEQVIRETNVGGVCFFVGTAQKTLPLIKRFQGISRVPLLVCIDAEWGTGMRLSDCYAFPKNGEFGKLPPDMDTLLYDMGREIGLECRNMGIHVNFAPVVDVNSNPDNPVIGVRSFSENPQRVGDLGIQYMKGLQSAGVMAVAKHFPGHGDTKTDSHFDLPVINHTREYMDTVDLYPFKQLINAGVEGVMTAHLQVSAYESEPNHPSSLSANVVSGLLRQKLGFKGLVITDGLDMKGVTKYYHNGDGELAALLAGTDILLLPPDVPAAINRIYEAAQQDDTLRQLIEMRCRRVLRSKYYHGCADLHPEKWHVPTRDDSLRCDAIVRSLNLALEGKIDSIVNDGIAKGAYPGCQVLAMQDGHILFRKAYGHQTYDAGSPEVTMSTVYDLASVTKVMSTTLAMMKLVETGKVHLDDPISRYLPYLKHTDKAKITIRQAMSHVARLKEFDAFWKKAQYAEDPEASVLEQIAATPLLPKSEYVYSDLGFILLGELVQQVTGQRLDIFVNHHFYSPMGLCHTFFNPIEHGIDSLTIAPTNNDTYYRHKVVQGVVQDENAYAMGGISGHAGLFSTADDLSRILQMLLDGGVYDGKRYLKSETIDMFNTRYFSCRRGLGFDKPVMSGTGGTAADEASQSSFGHTGYTGTFVWVDPEYKMTFVFLSNRTYPSVNPNKLAQMNIRTKIHSEMYKACRKPTKNTSSTAKFGN